MSGAKKIPTNVLLLDGEKKTRQKKTVVVTYAAMAIERMLAIKDRTPGQRPALRLQKESLAPFLESLFTGLFTVSE